MLSARHPAAAESPHPLAGHPSGRLPRLRAQRKRMALRQRRAQGLLCRRNRCRRRSMRVRPSALPRLRAGCAGSSAFMEAAFFCCRRAGTAAGLHRGAGKQAEKLRGAGVLARGTAVAPQNAPIRPCAPEPTVCSCAAGHGCGSPRIQHPSRLCAAARLPSRRYDLFIEAKRPSHHRQSRRRRPHPSAVSAG